MATQNAFTAGIDASTVATMIANAIAALPTSFVNNGAPMNINTLLTSFPAGASYNGLYARVNNLYNNSGVSAVGGIDDIVRCRWDETQQVYRWVPQREAYNGVTTATGGTVTLTNLVTAPTIRATGSLLSTLNFQPSATNAYLGQKYRIVNNATLNLLTVNVIGLIGANVLILGGGSGSMEYGPSGWFSTGS